MPERGGKLPRQSPPVVGRMVIDEYEFEIRTGLTAQCHEKAMQIRFLVAKGNDNANGETVRMSREAYSHWTIRSRWLPLDPLIRIERSENGC